MCLAVGGRYPIAIDRAQHTICLAPDLFERSVDADLCKAQGNLRANQKGTVSEWGPRSETANRHCDGQPVAIALLSKSP